MKFLVLTIFFCFYYENAWSYIDPGGIGAFFQILFATLVTSIFFLKEKISLLYSDFKNFLKEFRICLKSCSSEKDIVFFIESLNYLKYLDDLLKKLNNQKFSITCISSEEINLDYLNNFEIVLLKSNFVKNIYFSSLKCKILITTTPDLGTGYFKLSKMCKHYYYIFHSIVSIHTIYKKNAFKNFNTICCVGTHQVEEFLEEEKLYSMKKRNLFRGGYPFLDKIIKKYSEKDYTFINNKILIAPTWNSEIKNYYEINYSNIIEILLKNNYQIIFRPHPVYVKQKNDEYRNFIEKFLNNINFEIDNGNIENHLFTSELLVSDWSGISFEFSYATKRPVLFLNTAPKINNNDFKIFRSKVYEKEKRNIFGKVCEPNDDKILESVLYLQKNKTIFKENIEKDIQLSIFNITKSTENILKNIINIIS